jgi:hypothetical protein
LEGMTEIPFLVPVRRKEKTPAAVDINMDYG